MTKNLLTLSILFLSYAFASAQCIPDNTITKPGFYPKALPDGQVGKTYQQVIHFKVIKDTTVVVFGVPTQASIDSATVFNVTGIPDGMTFELNKPSKTYTPAEVGCVNVSGVPKVSGNYPINILLLIYAKIGGFKVSQVDTIDTFTINVAPGSANIPVSTVGSRLKLYPNPMRGDELHISSEEDLSGSTLSIVDPNGRVLETIHPAGTSVDHAFPYPPGVYFIRVSGSKGQYTLRFVKSGY